MGWASDSFSLPAFTHGSEFVSGNITAHDNVFESDYSEVRLSARDDSGHVAVVAFDGHTAPPGNDYTNYVVQDLFSHASMFYFHPDETPAQYWVRKGYEASWASIDGQMQILAVRGQQYGIHWFDTQLTMVVKNNLFHNEDYAVNDPSPNGQFGVPLNMIIEGNIIKTDIHSVYSWNPEGILIGDYYGGSPGTNAVVKDNQVDISYKGQKT